MKQNKMEKSRQNGKLSFQHILWHFWMFPKTSNTTLHDGNEHSSLQGNKTYNKTKISNKIFIQQKTWSFHIWKQTNTIDDHQISNYSSFCPSRVISNIGVDSKVRKTSHLTNPTWKPKNISSKSKIKRAPMEGNFKLTIELDFPHKGALFFYW